nr:MAG TPA: hypothetical protein [Caudoviricetes sp.]
MKTLGFRALCPFSLLCRIYKYLLMDTNTSVQIG